MGFDLTNDEGDYFPFNIFTWPRVLELAKEYAWEPEGTAPPHSWSKTEVWYGGYCTNDGQLIVASDAQALANALDAAVDDDNFVQRASPILEYEVDPGERMRDVPPEINATRTMLANFGLSLEAFIPLDARDSIDGFRPVLRKFSEFCRKGPIVIY